MKIKELVEEFDDFDLDLDDPEKDFKPGFKKEPIVAQLGKVIDSQGNPNPIDTVTTDEGKEHKVGPNMARALMMLLKGDLAPLKPAARERLQDAIQKADGLKKMLMSKTKQDLVQNAAELIDLQDTDKVIDKSIY